MLWGCSTTPPEIGAIDGPGSLPPAPILFAHAGEQRAASALTGDVLVMGGAHFDDTTTLVYQRISGVPGRDETHLLPHPAQIPTASDSDTGTIPPIAYEDHMVQLRWPFPLSTTQGPGAWSTYELWAVNTNGAPDGTTVQQWSNGTLVNDAQPLWFSPSWFYAGSNGPTRAGVPSQIKIVGRNLEPVIYPMNTQPTRACFWPRTTPVSPPPAPGATCAYASTVSTSDEFNGYHATFPLPALPAGTYDVYVQRDGVSWVPMVPTATPSLPSEPAIAAPYGDEDDAEALVIVPAPTVVQLDLKDYFSGCTLNDGIGDGACMQAALAAARTIASSGQQVRIVLDASELPNADPSCGTGEPQDPSTTAHACEGMLLDHGYAPFCGTEACGFELSPGVSLAGATTGPRFRMTKLLHDPSNFYQMFMLDGANAVSHVDLRTTDAPWGFAIGALRVMGADVTLTDSSVLPLFHGTDAEATVPVALGYAPQSLVFPARILRDVVATNNTIAVGTMAISLTTDLEMMESVIDNNTFLPGYTTLQDDPLDEGPVGIEGGRRIDISGNTIDGSNQHYTVPGHVGFRTAIYQLEAASSLDSELVSNNALACIGSRSNGVQPQGEAISIDYNDNCSLFGHAQLATSTSGPDGSDIVVSGDGSYGVPGQQCFADPNSAVLRDGVSLQVVSGTGVGQSRRIYATTRLGDTWTFSVMPALDVPLAADSRIVVGTSPRQVYIVGNTIDNSPQTCASTPILAGNAGLIAAFGVDWVVAQNRTHDTAGIATVTTSFETCPAFSSEWVSMWGKIANNQLVGSVHSAAYDGATQLQTAPHQGGIQLFSGNATTAASCPWEGATGNTDILGLGTTINRNRVVEGPLAHASNGEGQNDFWYAATPDGRDEFGAITIMSMYAVGYDSNSPGYDATVISNNCLDLSSSADLAQGESAPGDAVFCGVFNGDRQVSAPGGNDSAPVHTAIVGNHFVAPALTANQRVCQDDGASSPIGMFTDRVFPFSSSYDPSAIVYQQTFAADNVAGGCGAP